MNTKLAIYWAGQSCKWCIEHSCICVNTYTKTEESKNRSLRSIGRVSLALYLHTAAPHAHIYLWYLLYISDSWRRKHCHAKNKCIYIVYIPDGTRQLVHIYGQHACMHGMVHKSDWVTFTHHISSRSSVCWPNAYMQCIMLRVYSVEYRDVVAVQCVYPWTWRPRSSSRRLAKFKFMCGLCVEYSFWIEANYLRN